MFIDTVKIDRHDKFLEKNTLSYWYMYVENLLSGFGTI